MSDFSTIYTAGSTLYALVFNESGNVWDVTTDAFVTYTEGQRSNYAITMTGSGSNYSGSFPAAITTAGTYPIVAYLQAGGAPADSDFTVADDPDFEWSGTSEVTGCSTYADLYDALAYLNLSSDSDAEDVTDLLTTMLGDASAAIDTYCRRPTGFCQQTYVEDYKGTDDRTLQLRRVPLQSLTSVVLNAYSDDPVTIAGSQYITDQFTGQIELKPTSQAYAWFYSGMGVRHTVTYVAGYSQIPSDIRRACLMIVQRMWQQQGTQLLATQEKIGDYEAVYTLAQTVIGSDFGVQGLLNKYVDLTTGE